MAWADTDIRHPLDAVPALPVCAGTVAGVFGGVTLIDRGNEYTLWIAVVLAAAAIIMWLLRHHRPAVTVAFASLGVVLAFVRMPLPLPSHIDNAYGRVIGQVERVAVTDRGTRLILDDATFTSRNNTLVADINRGFIEVRILDCDSTYRPGDIVSAGGRLRDIAHRNRPDIPYSDDFAAMARVNGVVGFVDLHADSVACAGYSPSLLQRLAGNGAVALRDAVCHAGFSDDATAFVMAVLAGDETFMEPEVTDGMRAAGVAHVLALSGMHVGIIATLFAALLWFVRALPGGRLVYAVTLACGVLAYGFCVGMPPSVARAAVMLAVILYSRYLEWPCPTLNALFVAITIWLYVNPMWLWSPGFQLSCAALLGVVWFSGLCRVSPDRPIAGFIVSVVVVPVGALVATSLLTAIYFHALPVWFLPANIVTALMVPVIIAAAGLSVLCVAAGLSPGFLPRLVDAAYDVFERVLGFFASLPYAQITDIYPDTWQTVLWAVAVVLIFVVVWRRGYVWSVAAALTVCALAVSAFSTSDAPPVEVYVTASAHDTEVIAGTGGQLFAFVDDDDAGALNSTCRHLKGRRRCHVIEPLPRYLNSGPLRRADNLLSFDRYNMLVLDDADTVRLPHNQHLHYLLVPGKWRGDIVSVAEALQADTVLLPASLDIRLRRRWLAQLTQAGQPAIDISAEGWRYVRKKH